MCAPMCWYLITNETGSVFFSLSFSFYYCMYLICLFILKYWSKLKGLSGVVCVCVGKCVHVVWVVMCVRMWVNVYMCACVGSGSLRQFFFILVGQMVFFL